MTLGIHRDQYGDLANSLSQYERDHGELLGLVEPAWRDTLLAQIISSLRRVSFFRVINQRHVDNARGDPHHELFDPIRAASLLSRQGLVDEGVWMAFIGTHFGKHVIDKFKLAANVYGSFGQGPIWTLENYSRDPLGFERMLINNETKLMDPRSSGSYSNHRRYQSKQPSKISLVFRSFWGWQLACGGFRNRLLRVHSSIGQQPEAAFRALYQSMAPVSGFGRLGRFDFLTLIGKLELAPIEPDSVHLAGATGPLAGARLLFHGRRDFPEPVSSLEPRVDALDNYLMVGKQVIEDSLCNWQKNPSYFVYFKG
jgi:hypothetical protein